MFLARGLLSRNADSSEVRISYTTRAGCDFRDPRLTMETVVTWGNAPSDTAAAEVGAALRRATVLSAVILVATIALSAGIYFSGIREIHEPHGTQTGKGLSSTFELLRHFDRIALGVGELVIVGGIGALILVVAVVLYYRVFIAP